MKHQVYLADCLEWMRGQPENSVDLVFGSPPYEDARTYGIDCKLKGQEWVDWMVPRVREAVRICKGLVAFVVEGKTRKFRWSATPVLLMADLHRAGVHLRKPLAFHRVGIPGSGGPDWLRNDYEFIVCCTSGGKLPWSKNTAMGHPPKWAPGGEMSYRLSDGTRRNQWGHSGGGRKGSRKADGTRQGASRPSHRVQRVADGEGRMVTPGGEHGKNGEVQAYIPPAVANPGNVIYCKVGGGHMGSDLASSNEAPFPESLAEFFVRSFCPPGGIVYDPFCGSGTVAAVCEQWGRRSIGTEVRESQVDLTRLRIEEVIEKDERQRRSA